MEQPINEPFTSQESQEIYQNFKTIINSRLDKLYNSKGSDGEQYAYSIAVKQMRKKQADKSSEPPVAEPVIAEPAAEKPTTEEPITEKHMEQGDKLKEMIQSALSKPLSEKKKSSSFTSQYDDQFDDKRKKLPDGLQKSILKKQGNLDEDLDLGHEDNEPHMLKADLYRIGKYAMELYKMVDQFEGGQEVDFPHWWQAKIISAKSDLISAKHYLDFELKEPSIDTAVNALTDKKPHTGEFKNPMGENYFTGRHNMSSNSSNYSSDTDEDGDGTTASILLGKLRNLPQNNSYQEIKKYISQGDFEQAKKLIKQIEASEEGAIDETVDKTTRFDVILRNGKQFSGVKFINKNSFNTPNGGSYIDQEIDKVTPTHEKLKEAILAKLKK